jgi:hypothetical protein
MSICFLDGQAENDKNYYMARENAGDAFAF